MEGARDDPGLDDGDEVLAIDVDDVRHPARGKDDAARDRNRSARPPGPGGARRDRDTVLLADLEGDRHVGLALGEHDRIGDAAYGCAVIARMGLTPTIGRVDLGRTEAPIELADRFFHGISGR